MAGALFTAFINNGALRAYKAVSLTPGLAGMTHRVVALSTNAAAFDANIIALCRGGQMTEQTEVNDGVPSLTDPLAFLEPSSANALLSSSDVYAECHGLIIGSDGAAAGLSPTELLGMYTALRTSPYTASAEVTATMVGLGGNIAANAVWQALATQHPAMARLLMVNLLDASWRDAVEGE
jgi:hypothetical protein